MKITKKQLEQLVRKALEEHNGTFEQARVQGAIHRFVDHMTNVKNMLDDNNLKRAMLDIGSSAKDDKSMAQAAVLTHTVTSIKNTINKLLQSLNNMPELSQDPWHNVRKDS